MFLTSTTAGQTENVFFLSYLVGIVTIIIESRIDCTMNLQWTQAGTGGTIKFMVATNRLLHMRCLHLQLICLYFPFSFIVNFFCFY